MKSCARGRPYAAASEAKTQGKEIEVPEATSSIDDTTTAVRVFGGYRAGKFFAVEFGVGDFGEISTTLPDGDVYKATLAGLDVNLFGILPPGRGADRRAIWRDGQRNRNLCDELPRLSA